MLEWGLLMILEKILKKENFNMSEYNEIAKKLASSIIHDDTKLDNVIDKVIEADLNKPGMLNTLKRPFKKLYLSLFENRDNIRKGIRNLYSPMYKSIRNNISDYVGKDFANNFSKLDNKSKLDYIGGGIKSLFSDDPNSLFNNVNKSFVNDISRDKIKHLDLTNKILKSVDFLDLFKKLNKGELNNFRKANEYAKLFTKKLEKNMGNESTMINPVALVASKKIKSVIDQIEQSIK